MADIEPFDVHAYLGTVNWQDEAAQLETAALLLALAEKVNELTLRVNRLSRETD